MGSVERLIAAAVLALAAALAGCAAVEPTRIRLESVAREHPDRSRYVALDATEAAAAASVYRGGRRLGARPGMALQPGDEVETGDVAAVIWFAAYGTVALAERTRVRVGSLEVLFGRILAEVRGLFSASSENVVAGVEGTAFMLEVRPDRALRLVVLEGVVGLRSKTSSWPPVRMRAPDALYSPYPNRARPLVEPANPREIDELRAWTRRVRSAAPPPPPQPSGWCCDGGRVSYLNRDQCRGQFFGGDQAGAQRACIPPEPQGWCCADRSVSYVRRDQCRGQFFGGDQAGAQRACIPPEPPGWCCDGGRVSNVTRDQCRGAFYRDQASAEKVCRAPVLRAPILTPRVLPPAQPEIK